MIHPYEYIFIAQYNQLLNKSKVGSIENVDILVNQIYKDSELLECSLHRFKKIIYNQQFSSFAMVPMILLSVFYITKLTNDVSTVSFLFVKRIINANIIK